MEHGENLRAVLFSRRRNKRQSEAAFRSACHGLMNVQLHLLPDFLVRLFCLCCRPPEHNPFYSSIDSMPELKLVRRKSMPLVSDLVSHLSLPVIVGTLLCSCPAHPVTVCMFSCLSCFCQPVILVMHELCVSLGPRNLQLPASYANLN